MRYVHCIRCMRYMCYMRYLVVSAQPPRLGLCRLGSFRQCLHIHVVRLGQPRERRLRFKGWRALERAKAALHVDQGAETHPGVCGGGPLRRESGVRRCEGWGCSQCCHTSRHLR